MTVLISPAYPPDELLTAITPKAGMDPLKETRKVCVKTPSSSPPHVPRLRLPQSRRRIESGRAPDRVIPCSSLAPHRREHRRHRRSWFTPSGLPARQIHRHGNQNNSGMATGTGRGSVHRRMEDSRASKKVIVFRQMGGCLSGS